MERTLASNKRLRNAVNTEKIVTDNEQPRSFMSDVTPPSNFSAINQRFVGYLRLEINNNKYTIHSHIGTVKIKNTNDVKLKWENNNIVLYEGNSPLKVKKGNKEQNLIIEQEDIIGENKDDIIKELRSGEEVLISHKYIKDSTSSGVGLSLYSYEKGVLTGVLSFINFNDEDDPVLQKIKKETGGLYFTIEDDNIYISDKNGACVSIYDKDNCYKYQYTKNEHDILEMNEISTIIEGLTKTKQCDVPEAIESSIKAGQDFTLQKGKELLDDIYEANIAFNDKPIATLPKIGYYMFNDQLVMRNHVTQEKVVIPRDFHYLKVIKFNDDDYKLTFCNFLGNEFFEYKKYDPQYSNVSDEYKFISLSCMKEKRNLNLGELLSHQPSFFITEGTAEPDSPGNYQAAVFEVTSNGKGRKIATLIDEFGYFDKDGKFQYCDYHIKAECGVYDSSEISLKEMYKWTDENSEFYFAKDDSITLHTIPELL
ncbi:hypothetical protein TNIN_40131 [Trichonephila inaurata madagascariensis]|uniref:Uncharacterized protein n=1 Tax=Trichonephila inaurata madagascariensis TaxID=2747483 RepID=A0A8X6Y5Z9_9ARAC|nr:hypothetical protein TNIN_40131 [Trichonephila inaurata madagascariensis]